jgi:hypothetical protein
MATGGRNLGPGNLERFLPSIKLHRSLSVLDEKHLEIPYLWSKIGAGRDGEYVSTPRRSDVPILDMGRQKLSSFGTEDQKMRYLVRQSGRCWTGWYLI